MTVGPGIQPGLLTSAPQTGDRALAGYVPIGRDYRRWGVTPRPENLFFSERCVRYHEFSRFARGTQSSRSTGGHERFELHCAPPQPDAGFHVGYA
jgi:hypothetical protein